MPLRLFFEKAKDLIFPRRCEICAKESDRPARYICSECLSRLSFMPTDGCAICAKPIASGGHENLLCENCAGKNRPFFNRAASAFVFEGFLRNMLLDFKFNSHIWLKDDFTDFLEGAARARLNLAAVDLILPMSTTVSHLFDRGYNQCAILAKALAHRLAKPYSGSIIKRINSPRRQSGLSEEERLENVRGTFKILDKRKVVGRVILVVDDIMTTGATLSECARALKESGALKVFALTLASTARA